MNIPKTDDGTLLSPPPGSRIVHRREVLPVPIRRLSEIADELRRKHGRNVLMKQEGHELVFFSVNVKVYHEVKRGARNGIDTTDLIAS